MHNYTTQDKIKEDVKEEKKVIISNDTYAIVEAINNLAEVMRAHG